ncbi:MAG: NAD-dependent epimerase/dehydratase family protein [Candidatus Rokuibacteriota bacterium]
MTSAVHRVFVTGATGFVGHALVRALCAEGHSVRCLVRRGSELELRGLTAFERVEGDVMARQSLEEGVAGCDTVVHLVGAIREHPSEQATFERLHVRATLNLLDAAEGAGVRRFMLASALGARASSASRYHRTKWTAEEAVRASALHWTIFRPSVIYGRGDHFVSTLAAMVRRLPVVPVVGTGRQRLQPVPVEHVARAFARAVTLETTVKQTFDVGGPDAVSLVQLLDLIGRALGRRRVFKAFVPPTLVAWLSRLPGFPAGREELLILQEDNVCDARPFYSAFGIEPLPLATGLAQMLG